MEDVKLESINLKIGNKELKLTANEAKKLKDVLDELFGKEIIKEVLHSCEGKNDFIWKVNPYPWVHDGTGVTVPQFPYTYTDDRVTYSDTKAMTENHLTIDLSS